MSAPTAFTSDHRPRPWLALALLGLAAALPAADAAFTVQVAAGDRARTNTPVRVALPAADAAATAAEVTLPDGTKLVGQLTAPALLADGAAPATGRELHVVLPSLAAGQGVTLAVRILPKASAAAEGFSWHEGAGTDELRFAGKPVLRYMRLPYDAANRGDCYKVFHHLFDPSGERPLTKGPGGEFTHHRGIFYGYAKVSWGERKPIDIWHCSGETHQAHDTIELAEAGPLVGRQRARIRWNAAVGETFAIEQRELTVLRVGGAAMVDISTRLKSEVGELKLDGDPQHAGFHFRADNEVAKVTKKKTVYTRPDGAGKPGETRNYPDKAAIGLPWTAQTFVLGDKTYTVAYLAHPANIGPAQHSERDYGRFGSFIPNVLPAGETRDLRYRLWAQEGTLTVEQVAALHADFATPPVATLQ